MLKSASVFFVYNLLCFQKEFATHILHPGLTEWERVFPIVVEYLLLTLLVLRKRSTPLEDFQICQQRIDKSKEFYFDFCKNLMKLNKF